MQKKQNNLEVGRTRIKIKDLPRDMKISEEEMRKIHGGWWSRATWLVWRGGW